MYFHIASSCALIALSAISCASDRIRVDLEGGFAYQSRNTCAIPADGSKFSYRDLIGRGPFNFARLTAIINDDSNSGYRILVAPLSFSGT